MPLVAAEQEEQLAWTLEPELQVMLSVPWQARVLMQVRGQQELGEPELELELEPELELELEPELELVLQPVLVQFLQLVLPRLLQQ